MTLRSLYISSTIFLLALLGSVVLLPTSAHAVVECTFTRNLEVGVDGEDTRCLQQYLNETGFTVAESGPGSPGNETTLFRDLTKQAVIKWQTAKGVQPTTGTFGPLSQAAYLTDLVRSLEGQVADGSTPTPTPTTPKPEVAGAST